WLDLRSGRTDPVFQDSAFASSSASFSPDGRKLAYISFANNTLQLMDLQGGKSDSIPLGNQSGLPEVWSPSGDSILYGEPSLTGPAQHFLRRVLATGQTISLGTGPQDIDYAAAWSPDGSWIAIDRDVTVNGGVERSNQVWLVKPDGAGDDRLLL